MSQFYVSPMGLRIKELRIKRGLTQQELADRARMSRSQLAMIEMETRPANTLRLNALATALGVKVEDLFESGDESSRLIQIVRDLSPEDRAALVRIAEAMASKGV